MFQLLTRESQYHYLMASTAAVVAPSCASAVGSTTAQDTFPSDPPIAPCPKRHGRATCGYVPPTPQRGHLVVVHRKRISRKLGMSPGAEFQLKPARSYYIQAKKG